MWTSLDLFLRLLKKEQPAPVFGSSVARLKNANRTSRYSGETNPHYVGEKNNMSRETCRGIQKPLQIVPALLLPFKIWIKCICNSQSHGRL